MLSNEKLIVLMKNITVFSDLSNEQLRELTHYLFLKAVENDQYLFKEGDVGDFLCFVVSGKLSVLKEGEGKSIEVATLTEGDVLGEIAVIDGEPRSASVRATSHSHVVVLRKDQFDLMHESHPDISYAVVKGIARSLSQRLRSATINALHLHS